MMQCLLNALVMLRLSCDDAIMCVCVGLLNCSINHVLHEVWAVQHEP